MLWASCLGLRVVRYSTCLGLRVVQQFKASKPVRGSQFIFRALGMINVVGN